MKITWIGQSGYVLDVADKRIVIDPYLSNSLLRIQGLQRLFPVPVNIIELKPDFIYCTHDHLDHFDPETIRMITAMYSDCKIIGPSSVIRHARKLGISGESLILLDQSDILRFEGFTLTAMPAFHSDPYATGLLVETAFRSAYFSGDTENDAQLADAAIKLLKKSPDVFMVCINGKLGNMNVMDAIDLCKKIKPHLVVPNHYGLFAENTADPLVFQWTCAAEGITSEIMTVGQYLII